MTEILHIKNELEQLRLLDELLTQVTSGCQLNSRLEKEMRLALEEAVTNVILYAYPGEKDKDIYISITSGKEELKTVIIDSGLAFNPLEKQEPDLSLPLEERPIGGLGIFLVKQLMTEVKYSRSENKNILTMIKNIH